MVMMVGAVERSACIGGVGRRVAVGGEAVKKVPNSGENDFARLLGEALVESRRVADAEAER